MRLSILKASLAFIVCFAVIAVGGRVLAQSWLAASIGGGGETIALVSIEGIITAGSPAVSLTGGQAAASSVAICDRLYQAMDDPSVRGVLLRINSPGGSAVGSDEIYRAIVALKAAGKRYTIHTYDNVNHAFNNDTGDRYDKAAADLAWSRTVTFFKENLGAPGKA